MKTTTTTEKTSKAPTLKGVVVSNSMQKTLVVKVDTLKTHPKYLKQYRSSKKYKVHVEESGKYAVGTTVSFQECRPMSRGKHHTIIA
ncbi:MAG: 30S ribosomal protein S17 [Candidatus Moranbacteria bacterium]|jgi:small subunit ribosomal protein S17|nr:30S ribosomal protein S17 [Candidatus Moranbacteria bacterium]